MGENNKKILLLGGSYGQIPAIEEAKKRGLTTILCDYLPNNPGRALVDQYYEVSTTDKEAVLKIAQNHQVDAVLAYASDPAAVTQAYISEMLGLQGNSEESISLLSNKNKFRNFQQENNFNVPAFFSLSADQFHRLDSLNIDFPVFVKPVDASDSKGVFKVDSLKELKEKAVIALSFSRSRRIIVEENIKAEGGVLHGDAFFDDGEMVFCMLGDQIFYSEVNPLKPVSTLYPSRYPKSGISYIEGEVARIIRKSGFMNGPVNIEVRVGEGGLIYIMEIGPRSGGDLTPEAIHYCSGFDMLHSTYEFLFSTPIVVKNHQGYPTILYSLHSNKASIFKGFDWNVDLKPFIKKLYLYVKPGDYIKPFSESGSTIGVLILTFPDFNVADKYLNTLYETIQASIKLR
jgi:carbamoylphosphate synthase large subunit